jgi:hypothetical protein
MSIEFPRMLHRPDGRTLIVRDETALNTALASGWQRHAGPAEKRSVVAAEVAPVEIAPVAASVVTPIVESGEWTVNATDVETLPYAPVADAEVAAPPPPKRKARR